MSYAATHARALGTLTRKGAAVSFTLESPGTHDPETGLFTSGSTLTVVGSAVQSDADKHRLAGTQIAAANTVVFFTPTTRGQLPTAGYSVTWQSVTQTVVKTFGEVDPDGAGVIAAYVELAR